MVGAGMRPADDTSFTRFQRMLLGTDGTVTHILEAYAGEPVEVVKLRQEFELAVDADAELELSAEDKVLRRRVLLKGAESGRTLLYAEAVVALARVAPELLEGLVSTDKPIGILLAEHRTETFREILRVRRELAGPSGAHFDIEPAAELVTRTYRIVHSGQPMILITEKFPVTFFRDVPA
jgi:chorismate-pyruvate lyase